MVCASADTLKCFQCGVVRHKRFQCPSIEKVTTQEAQASSVADVSRAPERGMAIGFFENPGEGSPATPAPDMGRGLGGVSGQQQVGQGGGEFGEQVRGQGEVQVSKVSNATLREEADGKMDGALVSSGEQ